MCEYLLRYWYGQESDMRFCYEAAVKLIIKGTHPPFPSFILAKIMKNGVVSQ